MMQHDTVNRRIVLASHPVGLPVLTDFRLEQTPIPEPGQGQVLLRTLCLSLDPYMRGLMRAEGSGYAPALPLDAPITGATVSRIVASRHPRLQPGDLVLGHAGWQDYALSDGQDLVSLDNMEHPSLALGGLGMPGFTAHYGLLDIGQPRAGETVVLAAATGAVGAVAGQIARLKGARVIGIAGGADKCHYACHELGFDLCLDRFAPDLAARLAEACPAGIDVYFESVGGKVFDAVLPLLNIGARVPLCGYIAGYNDQLPPAGPDRLPRLVATLLSKRIRMQGFIIRDHYGERFDAFRRDMEGWLASGKLKLREQTVDGLENAPNAFIGLLQGSNFGKLVVRVATADGCVVKK